VDEIAQKVRQDDYKMQTLVIAIVQSVPFRYKMGSDPNASVITTASAP